MPSTPANAINQSQTGIVTFSNPTFSGTIMGPYDPLVGGSTSSTINQINTGAAGAILLSQGASVNPNWETGTSGTGTTLTANATTYQISLATGYGAWNLIQTQTVSTSPVTFTTGISSTYNNYMLVGENIVASSASVGNIAIQFSSNGGSSYISSGYSNTAYLYTYNATTATTSSSTSEYMIYPQNNTGYNSSFQVLIGSLALSQFKTGCGMAFLTNGTATNIVLLKCNYTTGTAMNALQVYNDNAGTISGTFTLYGITN